MALTRNFRETVKARAERDVAFRNALFTESIENLLAGDVQTGKALLRDYINATIGFETLAAVTKKSSKSLMRMLSPSGNPRAENIFEVIKTLQHKEGLEFHVQAAQQIVH